MNLREHRNAVGISQMRLARLSRVSRFKICLFELGDGSLTPDEQSRIRVALLAEAERLRTLDLRHLFLGHDFACSNPPQPVAKRSGHE
jgi:predicted transcriptional regulator